MIDKAVKLATILHHPETGCPAHKGIKHSQIIQWIRNETEEVADELSASDISSIEGYSRLEGELGDVLWCVVVLCQQMGIDPNKALGRTLEKMVSRHDFMFSGEAPLSKEEAERRYEHNKKMERGRSG